MATGTVTVVSDTETIVVQSDTDTITIKGNGPQGPPGPTGPAGSGNDFDRVSGKAIPLYSVVVEKGGNVEIADITDLADACAVIGVGLNSTNLAGETITIRNSGVVETTGFTWTPGADIYISDTGALTETSSTFSGQLWTRTIGHAISTNEIYLSLGPALQLA